MPLALFALLLQIGCAPAQFNGPQGTFVVWVCPPPIMPPTEQPTEPAPEERPS